MAVAILAAVVASMELAKDSEVFKLMDHELAKGFVKVHQGVKELHAKLHHKEAKK